jgi:hypothetical protein
MSQKHVQKLVAVLGLILLGLAATAYRVPAESKNTFINKINDDAVFKSVSSVSHQTNKPN